TVSITSYTDVSCFGDHTGNASAEASGGTPGYVYLWSTGDTGSVVSHLWAGTHILSVQDANGCIRSDAVLITQPPELTVNITHTDISCYGDNNGHVAVAVNGGTPGYAYLWNSGQT